MGNYQNTRHHKGPRELTTGGEWLYGRKPVIEALRAGDVGGDADDARVERAGRDGVENRLHVGAGTGPEHADAERALSAGEGIDRFHAPDHSRKNGV